MVMAQPGKQTFFDMREEPSVALDMRNMEKYRPEAYKDGQETAEERAAREAHWDGGKVRYQHLISFAPGTDPAAGLALSSYWNAPGFVTPRHKHDSDQIQFVLEGSMIRGNRVFLPGAGVYIPADSPYTFTAGPEGLRVLEFRRAGLFSVEFTESIPPVRSARRDDH